MMNVELFFSARVSRTAEGRLRERCEKSQSATSWRVSCAKGEVKEKGRKAIRKEGRNGGSAGKGGPRERKKEGQEGDSMEVRTMPAGYLPRTKFSTRTVKVR